MRSRRTARRCRPLRAKRPPPVARKLRRSAWTRASGAADEAARRRGRPRSPAAARPFVPGRGRGRPRVPTLARPKARADGAPRVGCTSRGRHRSPKRSRRPARTCGGRERTVFPARFLRIRPACRFQTCSRRLPTPPPLRPAALRRQAYGRRPGQAPVAPPVRGRLSRAPSRPLRARFLPMAAAPCGDHAQPGAASGRPPG